MNYKILSNGFEFEISENDIENLDIIDSGNSNYHIIDNSKSILVKKTHSNFAKKTFNYSIKGRNYSCVIKDKHDLMVEQMGLNKLPEKNVNQVDSPMPGLVLDIDVKIGQQVEEGQTLLILEAMKMENIIKSPASKAIKNILIKKGETVNKNQVLIEFE